MAIDHRHAIQKLLNVAKIALDDAVELAKDQSIDFVWKDAPFEAKFKVHSGWEVGSDFWNDSGCIIDVETFEESDWNSSSALC